MLVGGYQHSSAGKLLECAKLGLAGQIHNEQRGIFQLPEVDQQILIDEARPVGAN
jgi:hypothetical protein